MNICENCYWFELTNNQQLKGVCHNPHRRIEVVSEYCCDLFERKIEHQISKINKN